MLNKIISGGQTGADRAGLDWAIKNNIPHGGWCPQGRLAEDGVIPLNYQLQETPSEETEQRTEWNVRDSDGTAIFVMSNEITGGSMLTFETAQILGKPIVVLPISRYDINMAKQFTHWIIDNSIHVLNVAGSRESEEPGIYAKVYSVLNDFQANNNIKT